MEITEEKYIAERLNDQISWYDSKSMSYQKIYKRLKRAEVIFATLVPLLSGLATKHSYWSLVVGGLGAVVAIIEGFLNIGKYHENWIEYRSICETLKHEKFMYLTRTGVYFDEKPFHILVERVESVISHENVNWAQINKTNNGGNENGKEKSVR